MKKILVASLGCLLSFGAKSQSDLVVGSAYNLNIQRQNNHGDAFILHNASYSSSDDILSWSSTHPSFGSRGIRFAYGAGKGIYFYANETATTATTTFNPVTRLFIGNNGNVGIGTIVPASRLDVNGGFKAGRFTNNPSIDDHAVIRSSGTIAYDGGLVFTNSENATGYGVKFNSVNSHSVNPGLRIGVISLTTPNTYNKDYLYLGNEKVGVGTIDPSSKIHIHSGNFSSIMKFQRDGANTYEFQISGTIFGLYDLTSSSYKWRTNGANLALLESGGNVGIGTPAPQTLLSVKGQTPGELLSLSANNANAILKLGVDVDRSWTQSYGARPLYINDIGNNTIINGQGGNVGIGISTPHHKLDINGVIHSKEVLIDLNDWPDYVFESEFNLMPLSEVETFIKENKHLHEIPSAEEVKENGVALGEMNALLLKKIEELTLYVIEQNQR